VATPFRLPVGPRVARSDGDWADLSAHRDADKPKGQSGEWSAPLPLRVMMKRMDCENMDARTFKNWVKKKYGLEKVSRQSYQVRLDTMPKNLRACGGHGQTVRLRPRYPS